MKRRVSAFVLVCGHYILTADGSHAGRWLGTDGKRLFITWHRAVKDPRAVISSLSAHKFHLDRQDSCDAKIVYGEALQLLHAGIQKSGHQ